MATALLLHRHSNAQSSWDEYPAKGKTRAKPTETAKSPSERAQLSYRSKNIAIMRADGIIAAIGTRERDKTWRTSQLLHEQTNAQKIDFVALVFASTPRLYINHAGCAIFQDVRPFDAHN